MARPRKFVRGKTITSLGELWGRVECGEYVLQFLPTKGGGTLKAVNPGWVASWQFRYAARQIHLGALSRAEPNPEHPDNQKETP